MGFTLEITQNLNMSTSSIFHVFDIRNMQARKELQNLIPSSASGQLICAYTKQRPH